MISATAAAADMGAFQAGFYVGGAAIVFTAGLAGIFSLLRRAVSGT